MQFYIFADPCGTCKNGGKCVHNTKTGRYSCICMEGFRGMDCDTRM